MEISDVSGARRDIWLYELARGVRARLTLSQSAGYAVWSPDGSRIAYHSAGPKSQDLFVRSASGGGEEQLLLDTPGTKILWSWSADGRFIAYMQRDPKPEKDKFDIWILPLFDDRKPFPFLQTDDNKGAPTFSPDGRWMAYVSNESGAREVYVASFPNPATKIQTSNQGGVSPVWRPDGKELFYLSRSGQVMAVKLNTKGPSLQLDSPRALFQTSSLLWAGPLGLGTQPFDISRKDGRFVVIVHGETDPTSITVVVNWDATLKKK